MLFRVAVAEGLVQENHAELLYPTDGSQRERLILKLTGIAGMRPGEAYAFQWGDRQRVGLRITRRVDRGQLDVQKAD